MYGIPTTRHVPPTGNVPSETLVVGTRPMLAKIYAGEKLGTAATAPMDKEDLVAALSAHWAL